MANCELRIANGGELIWQAQRLARRSSFSACSEDR
jgi:hypothetical protein